MSTAPSIDVVPAFPVPADATHQGVSTRDWFAAMAMQGLVAKGMEVTGDRVRSDEERAIELATRSYRLADAMVVIRDA